MYTVFVYRILVLMLWIVHRCPVVLWHSQSRRQLRSSEECGGTGWFPLRRSSGSHEHCHVHVSHGCVDMFVAEMMTIFRGSCKRKANKLYGQAFATGIRSQPCIQSSDVHFKLLISCSFSFKPRFQLFTCFGSVLCMPRNLVLTCWCGMVASTWKQPQEMTVMLVHSKKDSRKKWDKWVFCILLQTLIFAAVMTDIVSIMRCDYELHDGYGIHSTCRGHHIACFSMYVFSGCDKQRKQSVIVSVHSSSGLMLSLSNSDNFRTRLDRNTVKW